MSWSNLGGAVVLQLLQLVLLRGVLESLPELLLSKGADCLVLRLPRCSHLTALIDYTRKISSIRTV